MSPNTEKAGLVGTAEFITEMDLFESSTTEGILDSAADMFGRFILGSEYK